MGDLRDKQKAILGCIRDSISKHDSSPTVREIQDETGISSTSVVAYNLLRLETMGYITIDRDVARGIRLTEQGGLRPRVALIPIVGTIAAGQPIPTFAVDVDPDDTIEVAPEMLRNNKNVYALRVKGNSMIDALVSDGDIVLLEATSTADDGDIVAAWLRDKEEAALKKIYREGDRVRLQPKNAAMAPIYADARDVEIHGKLIATISQP